MIFCSKALSVFATPFIFLGMRGITLWLPCRSFEGSTLL